MYMSTITPYPAHSSTPVRLLTESHSQVQKINKILRVTSVDRATAISMNFNKREVDMCFKNHGFGYGTGFIFQICHIHIALC